MMFIQSSRELKLYNESSMELASKNQQMLVHLSFTCHFIEEKKNFRFGSEYLLADLLLLFFLYPSKMLLWSMY